MILLNAYGFVDLIWTGPLGAWRLSTSMTADPATYMYIQHGEHTIFALLSSLLVLVLDQIHQHQAMTGLSNAADQQSTASTSPRNDALPPSPPDVVRLCPTRSPEGTAAQTQIWAR